MSQVNDFWSLLLLILLLCQVTRIRAENEILDKLDAIEVSTVFHNSNAFIQLQCFNGGTFRNGKCECTERFEGEQCEIEPCLNDGIKSSDSSCDCPWGTTGSRCERVTYCVGDNGRLENGKCICADRFSGIFCQHRLCHNGDFIGHGTSGYCRCDKGFTGPFCNQKLICIHGHITDENKCYCDPNWTGDHCDRCSIDHRLVGNECKIVVNEGLLIAPQKDGSEVLDTWSVTVIVGAVGVIVVLIAIISTIMFKKRQTKPTKIDSTLGTDV